MYRVMIIDDEPIIVEGISRIIPWAEYHCEIVATANDGYDGQELIRKVSPHMIISDIAMPGMDGLTMIAGLKSEFPQMEISILTGYRDFDYAQKAIRLGVTRFLLKPSNLEELKEAILAMSENLKRKGITGEKTELSKTNLVTDEAAAGEIASVIAKEALSEESENLAGKESAASSFIVKNALKYMETHYKQKLTLCDVADKAYVSQWHLSKLLNRLTGQNFSELLNTIRINEAKKLLKDPSLRIGDIAEEVGFIDLAHFSRVFKKTVGVSANEYRNQME